MLKRAIFVTFFLLSLATLARSDVICNRFRIICGFTGGALDLYLLTDLPDNTSISVALTRSYIIKGNTNRFAVAYFEGKSTVDRWRSSRRIPVDHERWEAELKKKRDEFLVFGQEFELQSVDSRIKVRMKVSPNQPDPAFGDNNENLKGSAVKKDVYPAIERELYINYPIPDYEREGDGQGMGVFSDQPTNIKLPAS
jgi:hypothetical protein